MTDHLLNWRAEFPILEKTVYLISHSLGAMPRATFDRLEVVCGAHRGFHRGPFAPLRESCQRASIGDRGARAAVPPFRRHAPGSAEHPPKIAR